MRLITAAFCLCCLWATLPAQPVELQPPILLKKTLERPTIDGDVTEAAWFTGQPARQFWQIFPTDSVRAPWDTEIFMTYDDQFLYVAAKCYSQGSSFVIPSLRRDYRAGGNDNITFVFDTFRDRTNAIVFGMNPLGVTREALISNGGVDPGRDFDEFWDNKWQGASRIHEGYWSCELAIPFSSLRFREGDTEWFFNSYRFDMQANVQSTWNRIPQNQPIMSLGYMGKMIWDAPLRKPGANASIIPYVNTGYAHRFVEDGVRIPDSRPEYNFNLGADAKIQVSSGLNLDLTINPDFSQVEVDRQVINLDRFEIFFPERRQFFLENADLFSSFGSGRINPFFSRRIGVTQDPSTGQNVQNPIYAGARLSGKLDNNWRIGLLSMQAAPNQRLDQPSTNYTVAALQRKVFSRSNIAAMFVNKQSFSRSDSAGTAPAFNRVAGLDYNIASSDNKLTGKVFYHRSFSPGGNEGAFAHGANMEYRVKRWSAAWEHQWVGSGYNAEVGFVPRKNFFRISPNVQYFFYPGKGAFNQHNIGTEVSVLWMPELGRTDHEYNLWWEGSLRNTGEVSAGVSNQYIYLFDSFDPSGTGGRPLPAGTAYNFTGVGGSYQSDRRPKLNYQIEPAFGQYFNGYAFNLEGSVSYRYQPYGSIAVNFNYTAIDLPEPYSDASVVLIGPRIDLTFSKSVFLTTFIQYNQQIDNININARLQWRYAPVSDFFLVYTDNYNALNISTKNRALVAKWTYWLNV